MITLAPLCTMTLALGKAVDAGKTPAGQRMAVTITSAAVSGRLNGGLAGAAGKGIMSADLSRIDYEVYNFSNWGQREVGTALRVRTAIRAIMTAPAANSPPAARSGGQSS